MSDALQSYVAQVSDAASVLVDAAAELPNHQLMLDALMAAYMAVAMSHPCCTHHAGMKARRCGMDLLVHAANNTTRH